jgi:hypothetical protein
MGADLETGMYYGGGNRTTVNNQSIPLPFDFVTGSVKGRTDGFTIKGESRVERGTLVSIFCCMHICTILCDRFTNPTKLRTAAAIPSEPVCVGVRGRCRCDQRDPHDDVRRPAAVLPPRPELATDAQAGISLHFHLPPIYAPTALRMRGRTR